jgi:mannose/fructose/N-acetylgalactosamine-specific phosphotransferase system component IIB
MSIVLIRVDDRLIHGQVLMGWTRALGVDHALVADDQAAADPMQGPLMRMAAPTGLTVTILPVDEAATALQGDRFQRDRMIVIVRGPDTLVRLHKAGLELTTVNVGNVRSGAGRSKLTKEVHASPGELEHWRYLDDAGVELDAQWLPDQKRTRLNPLLRA